MNGAQSCGVQQTFDVPEDPLEDDPVWETVEMALALYCYGDQPVDRALRVSFRYVDFPSDLKEAVEDVVRTAIDSVEDDTEQTRLVPLTEGDCGTYDTATEQGGGQA